MADDSKIGIEADLKQPADQMKLLADRVDATLKATKALADQLNLLSDAKFGASPTKQFDGMTRELLRALQVTQTLLKNDNPGGRFGKMVADGMAASIKANQTTFSRIVSDAVVTSFKDAEKLVKNSEVIKFLENQNKGASNFTQSARTDLAAGQQLSSERLLELSNRQRAAELLLASARSENFLKGTAESNKLVMEREKELASIRAVTAQISLQNKELVIQERAQDQIARAIERRTQVAALASIRGAARLTTQQTIDQSVGIDRPPSEAEAMGRLKAYYTNMAEKRAEIMASADEVAKTKAAAMIARRDATRAAQQGAAPEQQAQLQKAAAEAQAAYQASIANAQKDLQRLRLFGDGGQFLLEIQARLLLNYKVLTGFFQAVGYGISSVIQFDEALHQLQAITGSTKGEMVSLKEVIVGVAEGSRFTAVEVTKAATALAQAGLSGEQIAGALKPITQLATSTGSDLKVAVDVVTSVLGAFNYRAEETGAIVNIMAGALNSSKLDMEKLALGIQYSGNTAAAAGVNFSELTTVISALANTGVKSGSTLGTGVTQIIADLINPTVKLKAALESTGLTMADVDVRSRGLIPVLKTMAEAGFGAAQAFEGFELRGARAYLGLIGQVDGLQNLQREILLSNAAYDGNKIAMESMTSAAKNLQSNFGLLADAIGGKFLSVVTQVLQSLSDLTKWFKEWGAGVASVIITIGGGAVFALLSTYLISIGAALANIVRTTYVFITSMVAARAATMTFAESATYATISTTRFATALSLLGRVGIPLAIFATIELLAFVLTKGKTEAEKFSESLDKVKQKSNEAQQEVQKQVDTQDALNKAIIDLLSRYNSLSKDSESLANETLNLRTRFADLGLELPKTVTRVEDLIDALNRLKKVSQQQEILDLGKKINAGQEQARTYQNRFEELTSRESLNKLLITGTRGTASRAAQGYTLGADRKAGEADENLKKAAGVAPEIIAMIDAIESGVTDKIAFARSQLEKTLKGLEKRKEDGIVRLTPGDTVTTEGQINLSKLLLERSFETLQVGLGAQRAGSGVKNDEKTKAELEELQKPIYDILNGFITQKKVDLQKMETELKSAPMDKRRGLAADIKAQANDMFNYVDEQFAAYLKTLTEEQQKVAMSVFSRVDEGPGARAKSERSKAELETNTSNIEVNKIEQSNLEYEKRNIAMKMEAAQGRLKQTRDMDEVGKVNAQLFQLEKEAAEIETQLAERKKEALTGEAKLSERKIIDIDLKQRLQAMEEQSLNKRTANTQTQIEFEQRRQEATDALAIRAYNREIDAQMASLAGLLGKGMSNERKEKIFLQITNVIDSIIIMQLRNLASRIENVEHGSVDDPTNQARLQAIVDAGEAQKRSYRSKITNNEMRAGQEELSREMKQMLADITVSLQKLAQNFKDIERGLENANRAADNVQNRFNYSQAAYDAPQNRGRFSSAFKSVTDFNDGFDVTNKVRQMKIDSETRSYGEYQKLQGAAKERVDSLQKEKEKLEAVAGGNNVNSAALAAVKEKLSTAQGQYEQYTQAVEKARIELEKLNIETTELNNVKPAPTVFETLKAGAQSWQIQNGLFRDGLAQIGEQVPNMLNGISSGMTGFFNDITMGTKSAGDAFRDMGVNIIKSMLQIMNQMIAMAILKQALGFFGFGLGAGSGGGGSGSITTSVLPDITPKAGGGLVGRHMAGGGFSPNRDSIPHSLMPGEYVLRRAAVQAVGRDTLDNINQMGNRQISMPENAPGAEGKAGGSQVVNVWVVPPGQQPPPPSDKDIVAVITKDMMNGGATRQMLKSIQNGAV